MNLNIGANKENTKEMMKEKGNFRLLQNLVNGKNIRDTDDYLNFKALQISAEKYRKKVHSQDIVENTINEAVSQRQAILDKMQDHAQLLELKVERRQKIQGNAVRDLQQMDITEIGEELEYLRNGLIIPYSGRFQTFFALDV